MEDLGKKNNKELMEYQQKLKEDYELVRKHLIRGYDHWVSIEKEYNRVSEELKHRYGIKND
jgi:hypothetical protein